MKWKDEAGEVQRLRIFQAVSEHWKDTAMLLGFKWSKMEEIERRSEGEAIRCCQLVFKDWIDGKYNSNYPKTWAGLYELIEDVELQELAERMKVALESMDILV